MDARPGARQTLPIPPPHPPGRGGAVAGGRVRRLARVVGLLALAASGVAGAQVERTGDYLSKMDGDGDGRVSRVEYLAWMGYAFEKMDRDGDGVLSPAELPGGKGKPVTLAQHRQRLVERFARQDANGDGYLDARELSAPPR